MPARSVDHPASFTAWAFTERSELLTKISVPWKDPAEGQLVIKVLACGVCGTDQALTTGTLPVPLPRVPGHEIVGDVVAVGPSEKQWSVGDRVGAGCHGGHCFRCGRCRIGDYITCVEEDLIGVLSDGGYAEYVTVRTEAVASVPRDMDPAEVAPMMCAGVTVFNALRRVNIAAGEIVAVQGIGGLGHLVLQMARAMGYRPVALSSSPDKEEIARRLGAEAYFDSSKVCHAEELQKLGGAKVIVCTANAPELHPKLIPGLAVDGTLLMLAVDDRQFSISSMSLVRQRFSIRGMPNGTPKEIEDCIAFVRAHKIRCMVETFPLEKAQEAYKHRETARFRSVIVP
ncbi:GroES-like protein [Ganoderma leucocontextum]|nr:GroES-like protein [Ganoderma leucocontextum]